MKTVNLFVSPMYAKRARTIIDSLRHIDKGSSHRGRINRLIYGIPKVMRRLRVTQYMMIYEDIGATPDVDNFVVIVDSLDAEVVHRAKEMLYGKR